MFIALIVLTFCYFLYGLKTARLRYSQWKYQAKINNWAKPMNSHNFKCASKVWYKQYYCNCGYYDSKIHPAPSAVVSVGFWPVILLNNYITNGTYEPKSSDPDYIKYLEAKCDINHRS